MDGETGETYIGGNKQGPYGDLEAQPRAKMLKV